MNKFNNLITIMPIMINMMIILIMMMPMKMNKFHPIYLLIMLIFITFMICLKINFIKKSMIPFILFLIMIGGLMVIFTYITSLSNNEMFNFNYKILLINLMKITPLMLILLIMMMMFKQLILNNSIEPLMNLNINPMSMNIMYKESFNKSSIFIMMYLYYAMICIMNICYKSKLPLRQLLF